MHSWQLIDLERDHVQVLEFHLEEVFCLLPCEFDGGWYLLSGSYDGHVAKWAFTSKWRSDFAAS